MKKRSGFFVMARLIGLVKPLTGFMILAIFMGLIGHLCAAFITIFGGYAVLELLEFKTPFTLTVIFVCVVAFAFLRAVLRYGEQACNHFIAFKLLALIRDKVFLALRKLCPAKLEGKENGNLISVITSDIELLEVFYAHTISPAAIAFLFTVVMCVFIGSFHEVLGLVAFFAYITVGMVIPMVTSKLSGDSGIHFRNQSGELSSFVLDSLRGLWETLQYGQGENRLNQMNTMTDELSKEEERMKRISGRNMAVTNTVILLFDLIMLLVSALLSVEGVVDFEGVLIPTITLMSSFGPVVALANLGSTLQNTFAAGNRVLDILEEVPIVEEVEGESEITFTEAELSDVSFSYGEERILDEVSVKIPEGSVVGIVGKSGSGKSTLLKLLMRFWIVEKGKVQISGRDIETINTTNLRDMESFMTQETHLFHDSIKNNLRIAKEDAKEEEIIAACKKASVHEFIMSLPQGYDTPVGELGDTLSGGERQRLGLARAFLHDAPFLLLDEPTSNLDSLNEAVILKSLKEEGKDKTVVLVSHRQSTMRIADEIYSVEELSKTGGRVS
ncbi:MAG: thiol reductant ABC exporter subunit CydC [Lachnospiraceae bacterium]|nr:thiol reductant ABC exporter subunit CydC [Lachnospiraceae bacterium]